MWQPLGPEMSNRHWEGPGSCLKDSVMMEPRTNNATANEQHNRDGTTQPRMIVRSCIVCLRLRCSMAVALFVRCGVLLSRLRCSITVALFVCGCVVGSRLPVTVIRLKSKVS